MIAIIFFCNLNGIRYTSLILHEKETKTKHSIDFYCLQGRVYIFSKIIIVFVNEKKKTNCFSRIFVKYIIYILKLLR